MIAVHTTRANLAYPPSALPTPCEQGVGIASETLGLFLRLLRGFFFLHGLGRLLLGFLLAVHAFAHDFRSLMMQL